MLLVFCKDEIISCIVGSVIKRCAKFVNAGLLKAADKSMLPIFGKPANGFGCAAGAAVVSANKHNENWKILRKIACVPSKRCLVTLMLF